MVRVQASKREEALRRTHEWLMWTVSNDTSVGEDLMCIPLEDMVIVERKDGRTTKK